MESLLLKLSSVQYKCLFSCPDRICGQLNRWHCHWLTHWLSDPHSTFLRCFSIHVCIKLIFRFFLRISTLNLVSVYLTIQSFYMCRKFSPHCLWQISSLIKTMTTMPQLSTAIPSQPSLSLKLHCIQIYASATPRAIFTQIFSSPAFPSFPKLFLFSLSLVWQGKSHEGGRRSADCAKGPDIGFVSD